MAWKRFRVRPPVAPLALCNQFWWGKRPAHSTGYEWNVPEVTTDTAQGLLIMMTVEEFLQREMALLVELNKQKDGTPEFEIAQENLARFLGQYELTWNNALEDAYIVTNKTYVQ